MPRRRDLAVGLVLGATLDAVLPDPRRGHPVALFGAAAGALERRMWSDSRPQGAAYAGLCTGATVALGWAIERRSGPWRPLAVAASTWAVLGARSLRREGAAVHDRLVADDLAGARRQVMHLVARDPARLDADGVARAALESVAENTCDAIVAPLLWGAVAGIPGLLGYRAVNTLDAMVGYRSPRHGNFGWAAARLDDIANIVPARTTAALVALVAPSVGGDGRAAVVVASRYGRCHPSPNAGYSEAAFAGALGLRLGGRNVYAGRVEDRPVIGVGAAPGAADLRRATRLCAAVSVAATALAAAVASRRYHRLGVLRWLLRWQRSGPHPEWCSGSEDR